MLEKETSTNYVCDNFLGVTAKVIFIVALIVASLVCRIAHATSKPRRREMTERRNAGGSLAILSDRAFESSAIEERRRRTERERGGGGRAEKRIFPDNFAERRGLPFCANARKPCDARRQRTIVKSRRHLRTHPPTFSTSSGRISQSPWRRAGRESGVKFQ